MPSSNRSLPFVPRPGHLGLAVALAAVVLLSGCGDQEAVSRYTVEKPPPLAPLKKPDGHPELPAGHPDVNAPPTKPTGEPTDRMLGLIVPTSPQAWFFKLTGPKDAVAAQEEPFKQLVASLKFGDDGKPNWTLPEGWQEVPGNAIRYATLKIPGDKPLEVSVTALPNSGDDNEAYVQQNIERWRGQLQLSVPAKASEEKPIAVDGTSSTLVDMVGHASAGSMGRPPFFPGAPDGN